MIKIDKEVLVLVKVFSIISNIRTVLMSSTFEENNDIKTRIFGRCELATHECNDEGTKAGTVAKNGRTGFFGIPSKKTVLALNPLSKANLQLGIYFLKERIAQAPL